MDEKTHRFVHVLDKNIAEDNRIKDFLNSFDRTIRDDSDVEIYNTPRCRDIISSYKIYCDVLPDNLFTQISLGFTHERNVQIIKEALSKIGILDVENIDKIKVFIYDLKKCIKQRINYHRECTTVGNNYNSHVAAIEKFYRIYEGLKTIDQEFSQSLFEEEVKQVPQQDIIVRSPRVLSPVDVQDDIPIEESKESNMMKKSKKKKSKQATRDEQKQTPVKQKKPKKKRSKQRQDQPQENFPQEISLQEIIYREGFYRYLYKYISNEEIIPNQDLYTLFEILAQRYNTFEDLVDEFFRSRIRFSTEASEINFLNVLNYLFTNSSFVKEKGRYNRDYERYISRIPKVILRFLNEHNFLTYNVFKIEMQLLIETFQPENNQDIAHKTYQLNATTLNIHKANNINDEQYNNIQTFDAQMSVKPLKQRIRKYINLNRYYQRAIDENMEIPDYLYDYVYTNHLPETLEYSLFSLQQTIQNNEQIISNIKFDGKSWDFAYFFKKLYNNLFYNINKYFNDSHIEGNKLVHLDEDTLVLIRMEGIVGWKVLLTYVLKCSMIVEPLENSNYFIILLIFFNFIQEFDESPELSNDTIIAIYHDIIVLFYIVSRGLTNKITQEFFYDKFIKNKNIVEVRKRVPIFFNMSKSLLGKNEKCIENTQCLKETIGYLQQLDTIDNPTLQQYIIMLLTMVEETIDRICFIIDDANIKAIIPELVSDYSILLYVNHLPHQTEYQTGFLYIFDMYPLLIPFFFTVQQVVEYVSDIVNVQSDNIKEEDRQNYIKYGMTDKYGEGRKIIDPEIREHTEFKEMNIDPLVAIEKDIRKKIEMKKQRGINLSPAELQILVGLEQARQSMEQYKEFMYDKKAQ